MKKNIVMLVAGLVLGGSGMYAYQNIDQSEQVISNDQVEVTYKKVDNDLFDLIITPKGEMNITEEMPMDQDGYYSDSYLVGISKDKAEEINSKREVKQNIIWNQ